MKRARNGSGQGEGEFLVTGPCQEGKRIEVLGAALAYAMRQAGICEVEGSWYVRGPGVNLIVGKTAEGAVVYERRAA